MNKLIFISSLIIIILINSSFSQTLDKNKEAEKPVKPDIIYLYDGYIIKCRIIRITDKYIAYYPEGNDSQQLIAVKLAVKVVLNDGKVIVLIQKKDKITPEDGIKPAKEKIQTKKKEEKSKTKISFGARVYYADWKPVWEKSSIPFTSSFNNNPFFLYNPFISIQFNNKWELLLNFSYGKTASSSIIVIPLWMDYYIFLDDRDIKKINGAITIAYTLNNYLKIFFGPKYYGFIYKEDSFMISSNFDPFSGMMTPSVFAFGSNSIYHNFGPEIGISLKIPLFFKNLSLLTDISGFGLYGMEIFNSSHREDSLSYGFNIYPGISITIPAINIDIKTGYRYQYLKYHNLYLSDKDGKDQLSGFYVSLGFTF